VSKCGVRAWGECGEGHESHVSECSVRAAAPQAAAARAGGSPNSHCSAAGAVKL